MGGKIAAQRRDFFGGRRTLEKMAAQRRKKSEGYTNQVFPMGNGHFFLNSSAATKVGGEIAAQRWNPFLQ